jgi:F-type H+-transporting ATPase subunit gamma
MAGTSMRDIKRRIRSVTSIEHITNAMKLVSAAKLRRAKITFDVKHEFMHYIANSINTLVGQAEELPQSYLVGSREIKRTCFFVVTSNRGLAGSYNANIIKATEAEIRARAGAEAVRPPILVCVGNKGLNYFGKRGYDIHSNCLTPLEEMAFTDVSGTCRPVIDLYDDGEVDEIVIIYTSFVNTMEQIVTVERLLPFDPAAQITAEADGDEGARTKNHKKLREYEPSPEEVFNFLVPKYTEVMIHRALMESATCEHAARRMAMQNATDNAREMIDNLNLNYNRARQAAITSEITEIVSGADAIK